MHQQDLFTAGFTPMTTQNPKELICDLNWM